VLRPSISRLYDAAFFSFGEWSMNRSKVKDFFSRLSSAKTHLPGSRCRVSLDTIEVKDVSVPDDALKGGGQFKLESPLPGCTERLNRILIQGEIVSQTPMPGALFVCFHSMVISQLPLANGRVDQKGEHHYEIRIGVPVLGLPVEALIRLEWRHPRQNKIVLATINVKRSTWVKPVPGEFLEPCLITALGRSGTTRFMQLLQPAPNVRMLDEYPYECRMAQYFMQRLQVGLMPALHRKDYNIDNFYSDRNPGFHGPNPYFRNSYHDEDTVEKWLSETHISRFVDQITCEIDDFYRTCGGRGKESGGYFVEKAHPTYLSQVFRECYPGMKEIFLVRDFRDTFASMISFNRKRDDRGFGSSFAQSEEQFLKLFHENAVVSLCDAWRVRGEKALLMHYEDLCSDETREMARVESYLNCPEGSLQSHANEPSTLGHHQTSNSAADSIGKWKNVLSQDLASLCERRLRDSLELFGYKS
jgi:hypothetical protein